MWLPKHWVAIFHLKTKGETKMSLITSNAASYSSSSRMPNEEELLENTTNGFASSSRSDLCGFFGRAFRRFIDDPTSTDAASVASSSASLASEGTYTPTETVTSTAYTAVSNTPEDRQTLVNEVTRPPVNVDNFRKDLEEELKRRQDISKLDKEQLEEIMRLAEEDYRKRAEVMLDTVYRVIKSELIDVLVKLMNPGNLIKDADLELYKKRAELERLLRMQRDELASKQYTYPNTTDWTRRKPWTIDDSPYASSSSIDYSWQSAYGIRSHL